MQHKISVSATNNSTCTIFRINFDSMCDIGLDEISIKFTKTTSVKTSAITWRLLLESTIDSILPPKACEDKSDKCNLLRLRCFIVNSPVNVSGVMKTMLLPIR